MYQSKSSFFSGQLRKEPIVTPAALSALTAVVVLFVLAVIFGKSMTLTNPSLGFDSNKIGYASRPICPINLNGSFDNRFSQLEENGKVIYYYLRKIDNARVEKDQVVCQYDKGTGKLLKERIQWREDVPLTLPDNLISEAKAISLAGGKAKLVKLYYISPNSHVFPLKINQSNPCWVVTKENADIIIIDGITGAILGKGVPPPYPPGFSYSGPLFSNPCAGTWDAWYKNAEYWFKTMGYDTETDIWPARTELEDRIKTDTVALFYEVAHGTSLSFAAGCSGSSYEMTYASYIGEWIADYEKMPFTFLASCEGMCNTWSNNFSYEFRKGSDVGTVTVGYCGMDDPETCVSSDCWSEAVDWQDALFDYANQGYTIKAAFDQANADYPACSSYDCMRFAGDENLKLVNPRVRRVANQAPILDLIGNKSTDENVKLEFSVNASDYNEDKLTYSTSELPSGATFIGKTFSWTPTYEQANTYSITFTVTDSDLSDEETIQITVNDANGAPVLSPIGDKSVNKNSLLSFSVSASDPNNDSLIYDATDLPLGATFIGQDFLWTPTSNQAGEYYVTFSVTDGDLSDEETIKITVNNRAPVLSTIGNRNLIEREKLTFTVSASDPDNDPLTYDASTLPTGATFVNQNFSWTPSVGQAGEYNVTFSVTDGDLSDEETVKITVTAYNYQPQLLPIGNKSVYENELLQFSVSASDGDKDTLAYSAYGLPPRATFISQQFSWTPSSLESGVYSVTFKVTDGSLWDQETIKITVVDRSLSPVFPGVCSDKICTSITARMSAGESKLIAFGNNVWPVTVIQISANWVKVRVGSQEGTVTMWQTTKIGGLPIKIQETNYQLSEYPPKVNLIFGENTDCSDCKQKFVGVCGDKQCTGQKIVLAIGETKQVPFQRVACSDTDGGKFPDQYYIKGKVTNPTREDYCSGTWVREQYCDETSCTSTGKWYACPNGCSNGACLPHLDPPLEPQKINQSQTWAITLLGIIRNMFGGGTIVLDINGVSALLSVSQSTQTLNGLPFRVENISFDSKNVSLTLGESSRTCSDCFISL